MSSYRTRLDPFSGTRYVSAADLSQEQKRKIWEHLNKTDPDQAAFYLEPSVAKWIKKQDFVPRFPVNIVREALGE